MKFKLTAFLLLASVCAFGQAPVVISDGVSNTAVRPWGAVYTTTDPSQLMVDSFDAGGSLDTANNWATAVNSGGGVAAACCTAGNFTIGTGTTANGYSYVKSQPTFRTTTPGLLRFAWNITIESPVTLNTYRGWCAGAPQGSPTALSPISDGVCFEIYTDGGLDAAIYQAGVRTIVKDLSSAGNNAQPHDNKVHNYQIFYRPYQSFWYIDNVLVASSTQAQSALNVDTLPALYIAVAGPTAPASSGVLTSNAMSVSDTAKNGTFVTDGTYPFRKATIKGASTAAVAADMGLVTTASPNGGNPCVNPGATLQQANGTTSGTTAVQIVALSGTTKIYVCSMSVIGTSGTTPTFSLVQGTGVNCATGQGVLVPAFSTNTAGQLLAFANPVTIAPAGAALCYLPNGTTPIQTFNLTYVQQ
jgi:hypothetical protein